ncbi:MAG TPA: hypothetical protein VNI55_01810, partial [Gaiellaceae bacterium]|nr:hypothetical protein [Gaiellaceae bacterium]
MAIRNIGFNKNFYPRSGPAAGSSYYQTVQTMQNRGRLGGPGAALAARSQALNKQHQLGDYARPAY